MATRQQSASSTRVKRPRLQVVVSEPVVEKIEELAKERGTSVSATCSWILEKYFDDKQEEDLDKREKANAEGDASVDWETPSVEEIQRIFAIYNAGKKAGV